MSWLIRYLLLAALAATAVWYGVPHLKRQTRGAQTGQTHIVFAPPKPQTTPDTTPAKAPQRPKPTPRQASTAAARTNPSPTTSETTHTHPPAPRPRIARPEENPSWTILRSDASCYTQDGKCIGVLGSPHELARGKMAEELAVRGALVSEYPPGAGTCRQFFRARNRIAAGLSVGVAVIEAPFKSGTKLFVDEAVEQGKEIFAVPGNADSENCAGTNAMLKDGAKPVTEGWDVMSEFAKLYPDKVKKSDERIPGSCVRQEHPEPVKTEKTTNNTKKVVDKPEATEYIDLKTQLESLSQTQISIVSAMDREAIQVDEIIERTGLSPAKVLADLTLLQLMGCVSQQSGKRFTLNIKRSEDS